MPFLYDVWNVKLQQRAKGLVWSRGGKHFSKTFSIFYMLNSKNRIFNPYFWIDACRMRKILLRIIREFNLLSFWWKNNRFLWNYCLAIFMGNPSLKLSEVLWIFMNINENFKIWENWKKNTCRWTDFSPKISLMYIVCCYIISDTIWQVLSSCGSRCKLPHLHIHEYLWKLEKMIGKPLERKTGSND